MRVDLACFLLQVSCCDLSQRCQRCDLHAYLFGASFPLSSRTPVDLAPALQCRHCLRGYAAGQAGILLHGSTTSYHHLMSAGKLRLYVSNNDRQVRVFDMPSMRQVDTVCCPAPVNYSSLSPNGDLLACVGDSDETHLYQAGPTGDPSHPVHLSPFPHICSELAARRCRSRCELDRALASYPAYNLQQLPGRQTW